MTPWRGLKSGDLVDVIAPASSCSDLELRHGLEFLTSEGLRFRLKKPIFRREKYLAHSDDRRWSDLESALSAPDSQAVWCVRGGYGTTRILPRLLKMRQPRQCKLFIGLSDITALHIVLNQKWHWPTLFAPILTRMGTDRPSVRERRVVLDVIFGKKTEIVYNGLRAMNDVAKGKRKIVSGPIVGGNLTLVQAGLGTPWQLSAKGRILFLEDVGERGYRLDRSLQQMFQAGLFQGCRAVVLGDFVGGEEPDGETTVPWTLNRFFRDFSIPVFRGLPAGHGEIQIPVPLMTSARLEFAGGRGTLTASTGVGL